MLAVFHSIDPARKRARVFRMLETTTLFGEPALHVEWGRIGQKLCFRCELFVDHKARAERVRAIKQRRLDHGYTEVSSPQLPARSGVLRHATRRPRTRSMMRAVSLSR